VLSEASPELEAVREARQQNKDEARALATKIARELFAQVGGLVGWLVGDHRWVG
jgi:hypothetical protein